MAGWLWRSGWRYSGTGRLIKCSLLAIKMIFKFKNIIDAFDFKKHHQIIQTNFAGWQNLKTRYCLSMHIITRKRLANFANKNPACITALDAWYRILKHSTILNFTELRTIFPSADQINGLTVFNIGGNKARLIAAIHYNTQRLYSRHVLTHKEYDKNKWKEG